MLPKASAQSNGTLTKIKKVFSNPLSKTVKVATSIINNKIQSIRYKNILDQRESQFKQFSQKHINEKHINNFDELNQIAKETDYFVVGSDQVWNPYYIKHQEQYYFLQFVEKEKRIVYAPSFGISEIPEEVKPQFKEWISSFPYLSVTEKEGAKIIKDLTGRDVPVLVDPTLLLTKKGWLRIAKVHTNKPKSKYLIVYFWGELPHERKDLIKKIAKKYDLEIVSIADLKDKQTYTADPAEFIDYINSASLVLTDSAGLEKTIQSVVKQDYPNLEFLIIDGCSEDQTLEIIKKYEDHIDFWISEKDNGIYDAMNKRIDLTKGEWINFMNTVTFFFKTPFLVKRNALGPIYLTLFFIIFKNSFNNYRMFLFLIFVLSIIFPFSQALTHSNKVVIGNLF